MRRTLLAATLLAGLGTVGTGCASKLDPDKTTKAPHGLEKPIDTAEVFFTDVHTGNQLNLKTYMEEQGRDYVLLLFGSQGCGTCNREAQHLQGEVIGRHPLFLTDQGRRFEIIGVNTDQVSLRKLAPFVAQFPFIKWSDPIGTEMRTFFLPKGMGLKVPLTVMLRKDGSIAWRVLPDDADKTSVDQLMSQVETTLGLHGGTDGGGTGGDTGGDTGGTGGDTGGGTTDGGTTGGGDTVPAIDLASEGAGRFKSVAVTGCDGQAATLDQAFGAGDVRFVQVVKGACDGACESNVAQLKTLSCTGFTCAAATLNIGGPGAVECQSGLAYKGGAEFYDVFTTHFNWAYTPLEGGPPEYKLSLPAVAGPLVMGFNKKGELVYSHEGALPAGALLAAVQAPGFGGEIARGPDFAMYGSVGGVRGEFKFADWRRQTKYTVLSSWGAYPVPCGSCIDELHHWSEPGGIVDLCAAHPAECQIGALESHTPQYPATTLAAFYDQVVNGDGQGWDGFAPHQIRVPLVLDAVPDPDGNNYLHRLFDGYMSALHPEWNQEYRTFIYDREGKVVAAFKSAPAGAEDPVRKKLTELLGVSQ